MKKNLRDAAVRTRMLERLRRLKPSTPARWGRMNATEMVCHVSDGFRTALGDRPALRRGNILHRTIVKWLVLYVPANWPTGAPTAHEFDQERGGTKPTEFPRDVLELELLIERFGNAADDFVWAPHPAFGRMSVRQYARLAWLHLDHHLRQFGE